MPSRIEGSFRDREEAFSKSFGPKVERLVLALERLAVCCNHSLRRCTTAPESPREMDENRREMQRVARNSVDEFYDREKTQADIEWDNKINTLSKEIWDGDRAWRERNLFMYLGQMREAVEYEFAGAGKELKPWMHKILRKADG